MFYSLHTLSNGIRLLHVPAAGPVVYCGFVVNAGSRDERPDEQGMAHFVEHMLFKGTEHRRSSQVIGRLEAFGGQLDAYTTKDATFVYATVPLQKAECATELLGDIVLHSTFPEAELEHERGVVLEEIQLYNDTPSEQIFDDFDNMLFSGSSLGHNILGNEQSLADINSERMRAFVRRCYTTDNLLFFMLGSVDEKKILHWAERYFGVAATYRTFERIAPSVYQPETKVQSRDTYQTHFVVGNRTCSLLHDDSFALRLLNNILGGPNMSSRLNMAVRERCGLAYTIDSTLSLYPDTGSWCVYFGCDHENEKRCIRLINNELQKLIDTPLTPRQLQRAKCQYDGQMLIENENRENLILAMANSILKTGVFLSDEQMHDRIAAVTAEKLQQLAAELFPAERCSTLIYR